MSASDEIRAVLRNAGEPMHSGAVCEALGCETRDEKDRVYKTLASMATTGNGVEKLDDGRYTLIPGWTPKRQTTVRSAPNARNPPRPNVEQPAPDTLTVTVDAGYVRFAADDVLADLGDKVLLPRRTVRTLVATILATADRLTDEQRQAVVDATREAA